MKQILELVRWIAYVGLILTDGIITVMSMASIGHNPAVSIGLGIIGGMVILLMTWVFLKGIRAKGVERFFYLGGWALACVLVVSINWAFARTNLFAQAAQVEETQEESRIIREIRARQIESTQTEIDALLRKLDAVSVWREKDREAINADLVAARDRMSELVKPVERKAGTVSSVSVFRKMASPFGWGEEQTADFWWALAFVALQVFAVLAAPKGDEDAKGPAKRKRAKPPDWSVWIEKWVWANWSPVRTGRPAPRRILGKPDFMEYVRAQWRQFPEPQYGAIYKAAQRSGVLDGETIVEEDEGEARKKIAGALTKI